MLEAGYTPEEAAGAPRVRLFTGSVRRRRIYRVPFGPKIRFGAHDNCVDNVARAVLERVWLVEEDGQFVRPPRPVPGAWARVRRIIDRLDLPVATPISRRDFPKLYDEPRKRKVYELAVESLERAPLTSKDSEVEGFGKFEKTNFTEKPNPTSRIIQPRDPRYNVEVGVFLKPMEHRLYHAVDLLFRDLGCHEDTVAKSHNFNRRAKILFRKFHRFKRPVALLFDAKRFDQHVSVDALRAEHEVYLRCYRHDRRLRWLLVMQLYTVFKGRCDDGVVTFQKAGGRCSGDMNTAVGNVLLMCLMMADYMIALGIDFELYDDGDDSVLIIEDRHLELVMGTFEAHFRQLGFTMKLGGAVRVFEEIEFCQTHPVFDGRKWTMVRDPRTAIAKDCISTLPHATESVIHGWMAAVADCGEAIAGSYPVWDSFYRLYRRTAAGARAMRLPELESGMFMLSKGMHRRFAPVQDLARVSFWRAFGWEPALQIAFEEHFDKMSLQPGVDEVEVDPDHPGYDYMCSMPTILGL